MRILLDMDEVIVEFNKPAHERLGIPVEPWQWPVGQFVLECYDEEFWEGLDREWWAGRSWTSYGKEMLDMLQVFAGPENVTIFTSVRSAEEVLGKLDWLERETPKIGVLMTVSTNLHKSTKQVCAGPGIILVDDYHVHVEAFRKAGGHGILAPAMHNHMHRSEPVKHVRRHIVSLIQKGMI